MIKTLLFLWPKESLSHGIHTQIKRNYRQLWGVKTVDGLHLAWADAHSQIMCSTAVKSLAKPEITIHSWIL